MNSPSDDIKDRLVSITSLGLTFASNLFIGREPATPANVATIYDTPGYGAAKSYLNDIQYERPSVQIRVRNVSYPAGWALINDIMQQLHNTSFTIGGAFYTAVFCSQLPALLDWQGDNARFVATFDLHRRISA